MNFDASTPAEPDATGFLPPNIVIFGLINTYGALFFGMCVCILLYGVTLFQVYRYYRIYPQDQKWLKLMVFFILTVETAHTIMIIHLCYYHLVAQFFNPLSLLDDVWSFRSLAPLQLVAMLVCQSFYLRRVSMFGTRCRAVVAFASALLLGEGGCYLYVTVLAYKDHNVEDLGSLTWIISAIYGLAVAVDCIVTAALITILLKSRTGFKSTDSLIQTLIVYSINSGLTTSIAGMLTFIFALVLPGNFIYIAIAAATTKLYANSVLAVMNARRFLSGQAMDGFATDSAQFDGGNLQPAMSTVAFAEQDTRPAAAAVSLFVDAESGVTTQRDSASNEIVAELMGDDKV